MEGKTAFLYGVLLMSWLESVWSLYLVLRQRNVIKSTITVPPDLENIMSSETFSKARSYHLDSITFGIVQSIFDNIIGTVTILCFLLPYFWKLSENFAGKFGYQSNEVIVSIMFLIFVQFLSTITSLPFSIYNVFVLEEKHGFNKQTAAFYAKDKAKGLLLMTVLVTLLTSPVVYIVRRGGDYFFFYLWLFTALISLFLMTIYPAVIAPLFDKYTPLPEGPLRTRIEQLASSVGFPLKELYVVEGSKRSAHSNAYFYGFYNNKRIVLFDTLLMDYKPPGTEAETSTSGTDMSTNTTDATSANVSIHTEKILTTEEKKGCTDDEVLAVLAHELGHWKMNHVLKQIILLQLNLLLMFLAFSYLFKYRIIYEAFGFVDVQPVIIGLTLITQFVFLPYNFLVSYAVTVLSRSFEFEADAFAKGLGMANYLRSSLIKLTKDNLGFPVYDWLYSSFTHSHPPLLDRLAVLDKDN